MNNRFSSYFAVALSVVSVNASATASEDTLAQLGKELTALGALQVGSADGRIPAWTGGIATPPADYSVGDLHADPFAADKVLFTITKQNIADYKDQISEGYAYYLSNMPEFKMHVYPTRRSAAFPQRIYDKTIANARTAQVVNDGWTIAGATEGVPFPVPKNGLEAIWNFKLTYRGDEFKRMLIQANPSSDGSYELSVTEEYAKYPYSLPDATIESIDNIQFVILHRSLSPISTAGQLILAADHFDMSQGQRSAWVYNPQQRRVRRAPTLTYDNPSSATEGIRTNDQGNMFNGAVDRYDWKLVGRKEMIVPYNAYKLHSSDVSADDIIRPNHINPELVRYEAHRMWVVNAHLKAGASHLFAKRTFYLDEDSWQATNVDLYDNDGKLVKMSERHNISYYEVPVFWTTLDVHYDLASQRYNIAGLDNDTHPVDFSFRGHDKFYDMGSIRMHAAKR